jgi:hypothetical protein
MAFSYEHSILMVNDDVVFIAVLFAGYTSQLGSPHCGMDFVFGTVFQRQQWGANCRMLQNTARDQGMLQCNSAFHM